MIRPPTILSLALIGLLMLTGPSVQAQPTAEPFSTIDVRLSGAAEMSSSSQLEQWSSDYAGSLLLSTPFYAGNLQTGVRIQPFESASSAQPSFWSGFLFLGWHQRWSTSDWLHVETGARVGNFFMAFDEDDVGGVRNESELATAGVQSIHIEPFDHIGFFVEGSYTKVFTSVRMKFVHLSAGITYRFHTPEWLKAVVH